MPRGLVDKPIVSFNAGELSPKLDARTDLDKYNAGCRTLQNAFIEPYGDASRRVGTQYRVEAKDSSKRTCVLGFKFSTTTNYILEFGEHYIRFCHNGEQVTLQLSDIPADYWTNNVGYPVGTYVKRFISGEDHFYRCIAQTFDRIPPFQNLAPENGGDWLEVFDDDITEVTTPWDENEIFELKTVQINDVVYVSHGNHPPYKLSRLGETFFTIAALDPYYPPLLDENDDEEKNISLNDDALVTAWVTATVYPAGAVRSNGGIIYVATLSHTSSGSFSTDLALGRWSVYNRLVATFDAFLAGHVGAYWQITHLRPAALVELDLGADGTSASLPVRGEWELRTHGLWTATLKLQRSLDEGSTWHDIRVITGSEDYTPLITGEQIEEALYRVDASGVTPPSSGSARVVLTVVEAYVSGVVQILEVASSTVARVRVIDAAYAKTETPFWAEGAWSGVRGYPRAVTLHEQRLCFGGTTYQQQTIWGSVTNDFENYKYGTVGSDAFRYTIGATEFNAIVNLVSQTDLIIFTTAGEWAMSGGDQNTPISPEDVKIDRQTEHGSASVSSLVVNDNVIFVQRTGRKLREFSYSFEKDNYIAPDLTILSEHVTEGGIVQMAYQRQANSILWAVTGNGLLIGLSYEPEQNVAGWHRHTTDGIFESVTTIYGEEDDEVWFVVRRTIDGETKRYLERFNPTAWTEKQDCFFVDCGITYSGSPTTTIAGLDHLEGKTVDALADGSVVPGLVVTGGQVTLSIAASVVQVGLPYETVIKPMRMDTDATLGNTQGVTKVVWSLVIRFLKTLGCKYGDGVRPFRSIPFRNTNDPMDSSPAIFTGDKEVEFEGDLDTRGDIVLKQDQPLPLTVTALTAKYRVTGK